MIRIYIAAYRYTYDEITEVYGDQLNQTENGFSVIDEAALRSAIGAMGYEVKRVSKEPHEKRGLFHR